MLSAAASHLKSSLSLLASSPLQMPKIGCCFSQVLAAYYLAEQQFESEREGNLNLCRSPPPCRVFTVPQISYRLIISLVFRNKNWYSLLFGRQWNQVDAALPIKVTVQL